MSIERFPSGGAWEEAVGYSRAVRAGPLVFVAGCTGVGPDGEVVSDDPLEQMRQACRNVAAALALAGASLADVVQTRISVTDIGLWEVVGARPRRGLRRRAAGRRDGRRSRP